MNTMKPFFLLIARASVFWLGALGLFIVAMTSAGLMSPDSRFEEYINGAFVAAFTVPLLAGWLAGAVVQEFQHTSFAALLPGVRSRTARGFLFSGFVVVAVTIGLVAVSSSTPQNLPMLFVVGLGSYCLGGILLDPLSIWVTSLNVVVALLILGGSGDVARIAAAHPWIAVAFSAAVGTICVLRLFARHTFRLKPFRATSPLPGRFSFERAQESAGLRRSKVDSGTGWAGGYLGTHLWRWVRAAMYEMRAARGWNPAMRAIGRAWGLALLIVLYAWADKGEMSFGEALARSIYDALFRSPHQAEFGEKGGPFPMVMIVLAAAGAVTALFAPITLTLTAAYPLSRLQRARIHFRAGLADAGIYLFVAGPFLLALGHLMGRLVGYPIRFDFMPFYFRVMLVTVILIPLAHWGRLGLVQATRRKAENTLVAVGFGICAFVIAVAVGTFLSPRILGAPAVELSGLAIALIVSQLIYRQGLASYYRTVDL